MKEMNDQLEQIRKEKLLMQEQELQEEINRKSQ